MKTKLLNLSLFTFLSLNSLQAGQNKSAMLQDLSTIKGIFETSYAPIEWKKENDHWQLDDEYQKSISAISDGKDLTLKEYQQQLRKFMNTAMDYHVGIMFYSTEYASLPFRVKTVDGHTYVDWINPIKLSKQTYGLHVGDEILQFNGMPIADVLAELSVGRSKNSNDLTDIGITDENLTQRFGTKGDIVPKGTLYILFQSLEDGKTRTNQMIWEYLPELIKTPASLMQTIPFFDFKKDSGKRNLTGKYSLCNELCALYAKRGDDDGSIGSRISFVPLLGTPIWVWEENLEGEEAVEGDSDYPMWNAYIFENSEGIKIGYIRIPHYDGEDEDVDNFGKIIDYMEKNTEALIVDQVNNYGGSVSFLCNLATMLAIDPLKTPKHRLKLTHSDVYEALADIKFIDKILNSRKDLKDVLMLFNVEEEAISYQQLLFLKYFFQYLVDEWNEGRDFTLPTYIDGTDHINPNPNYQYTKPILLLTNELDFSGGDFFPAILQDNKRAVIFGSRTAGAGGFIKFSSFPNKHGIRKVGFTASLAERESLQKIESIGVIPDIEYTITSEDVQNRYVNYGIKVNEVISGMLPRVVTPVEPEQFVSEDPEEVFVPYSEEMPVQLSVQPENIQPYETEVEEDNVIE